MTKVINLASHRAAVSVRKAADHEAELLRLWAQAVNSLNAAVYILLESKSETPDSFQAATTRAHRGMAALKQASALVNRQGGAA